MGTTQDLLQIPKSMAQHVSSIIRYLVQTDQAPLHGNICPRQPGSILDDTCVQAAIPTQSSLISLWLVQAEVLWLMHAKHRWLAGDVKGARDIMDEVHCPIRTALIKMHACMHAAGLPVCCRNLCGICQQDV